MTISFCLLIKVRRECFHRSIGGSDFGDVT